MEPNLPPRPVAEMAVTMMAPAAMGSATMMEVVAPVSSPLSTFLTKSFRPFFRIAVTTSSVAMATRAARMGV